MTPTSSTNDHRLFLPMKIASAGLAGCTADIFTFPLDTLKVWLQVSGETKATAAVNTTEAKTSNSIQSKISSMPSNTKNLVAQERKQGLTRSTGPRNIVDPKSSSKASKKVDGGAQNARLTVKQAPHQSRSVSKPNPALIRKYSNLTSAFNSRHMIGGVTTFETYGVNQNREASRAAQSFFRTVVHGVRSNGFLSLYGGLGAGLQRQLAFCAVRIGLYDTVKGFYRNLFPGTSGGKQIPQRILAGSTTAFIAVALFQPTEVVKIRMQAQNRAAKSERMYSGSLQAYRQLYKVGGLKELWKGVETNAARLGVVNVSELVTYDLVKEAILEWKLMKDTPSCHFISALISGFITTLLASPIDVVKTRYMNSQLNQYKGPIHCAKTMFFKEGLRSFYKGFVPSYLRLGSWNIVMFVSYEQYKILSSRLQAIYDAPTASKHTYASTLK